MNTIMTRRSFLAILLAFGTLWGATPAFASSFRFVDEDGVVHFTNAPADPRYRRFSDSTGTGAEWLRLPGGVSGRYADLIREAASRYGVDPGLVEAVVRMESGFDPWAVSSKGAQGLMQLMPRTASTLGVRDAFNPRQNINGGVRHLRTLLDRYAGNLPLALAAYNAGDEAVRWYHGVPPYPETQQYVRKIIHSYGKSAHPSGAVQPIYRYEDPQGVVTYTNVPRAFPR